MPDGRQAAIVEGLSPRERGTVDPLELIVGGNGLSPRERGNPTQWSKATRRRGSIPARAGEPPPTTTTPPSTRVYPRASGGTMPRMRVLSPGLGLSPRERGNRASAESRAR